MEINLENQYFTHIYERKFSKKLLEFGFTRCKESQTLQFIEEDRHISLIRLGGRSARPGCIRTILCFRHTFLRPVSKSTTLEVFDFTRKLHFSDFRAYPFYSPAYTPLNLDFSGKIDTWNFKEASEIKILKDIDYRLSILLKRVVPWSRKRTHQAELKSLQRKGEGAWCEDRWIEDYKNSIGNQNLPETSEQV
ncbi:hypothetical protein PsAD14_00340 [Pseudovibrio sp. Ad14]|nr:hypothetical protein PsW74_00799 [Pseudovibrio sp. W74]KZL12173.1 hypothetical protein PsAD14_00340 [Pseudovibrio sp. Ad14]